MGVSGLLKNRDKGGGGGEGGGADRLKCVVTFAKFGVIPLLYFSELSYIVMFLTVICKKVCKYNF